MKKPEEITSYDFPDAIQVPDGYDLKAVPVNSMDNLQYLVDEHNNLVEAFNAMAELNGFNQFVNYDD